MTIALSIRPNGRESKLNVVITANPAGTPAVVVPADGIGIYVGNNLPAYNHLQKLERISQLGQAAIEDSPNTITATQYGKFSVAFDGSRGTVAYADAPGADVASEDEVTLYIGENVIDTASEYMTAAVDYIQQVLMEESKAA